ncbi:MAG: MFS transporter, partial [Chloroflexota bacterium]
MSALESLPEKEYRGRIRAWMMYDWANSAFATTILAAVLPVYYSQVAGANLPSAATATQYWSVTLSISVLIVAIISPFLGTVSDVMRGKKRFLAAFVWLGVLATGMLYFVDTGDWLFASIFFIIARVGFGSSIVFYDALLPHVAKEEDQDRVSTWGYALGYLGGGILLAVNIAMIQLLPGTLGVRLSLLSVALWWLLFSIPIFRRVPEPDSAVEKLKEGESILRVSFSRLINTLREIRSYKDLFNFLIGFLIYNDGIGIIISVAAIYGAELGFPSTQLILAILLVQFVGIPYSIVFGNLPAKGDKRQSMYVAFIIFNIVTLPLVAIAGKFILPQGLTGLPSPDFAATATAVGQGTHAFADNGALVGEWDSGIIPGSERGQSCAWYAFNCDESQFDALYTISRDPGARAEIAFNGQPIEISYSTGPEHGIWQVELDGALLLDDDGNPIEIDAYNPTVRYDVTQEFLAESEGEHVLALINTGRANEASSGTVMSLANLEVLQPLRTSSLGVILGMLFGLTVIGALFAYFLGPLLFQGIANMLDTKRSIFLALIAYSVIAVWGFFLNAVIEFWFLA